MIKKLLTWYYKPDTDLCYWHRLNYKNLYICRGMGNHIAYCKLCKYCPHYKGGE